MSIDVISKLLLPTAFSHRPQLTHAPLKNKSAYGAPSECSLERFEHVLQLSYTGGTTRTRQTKVTACRHRELQAQAARPPFMPPPPVQTATRSNFSSSALTSRVSASLAPPGVLNRASEHLQWALFTVLLIRDFPAVRWFQSDSTLIFV